MASFNKVILLGNLTRDPEVRYTPKGSAVCDLGIAINRQYTLDSGEKREEVTYVDVVLWSRLAEIAGEYLKKGPPGAGGGAAEAGEAGENRVQVNPLRRQKLARLRSRTTTKFRFKFFVGEP